MRPPENYGPRHLDLMLAYAMSNQTFANSMFGNVPDDSLLLNEAVRGTTEQAIIMKILRSYWRTHQVMPDSAAVTVQYETLMANFKNSRADHYNRCLRYITVWLNLCGKVTQRSEPLAKQVLEYVVDVCVIRPQAKEIVEPAGQMADLAAMGKRLQELAARSAAVSSARAIGGHLSAPGLEAGERVSTGIPWIDAGLGTGAGPVRGSGMAIIAPNASGKTTFGVQFSINQALLNRPTMLVLAEDGLNASMRHKLVGCALGIPYTEVAKHPNTIDGHIAAAKAMRLDPEVAEHKIKLVDRNLHIVDLVTKPGGLEVIEAEIEHMRGSGMTPVYGYIDWAGALVKTIKSGASDADETMLLTDIASFVSQMANRYNMIMCVSQQMAAESISKGPLGDHNQTCVLRCRNFTDYMKYAWAIGPICKTNGIQLLTLFKAREDPPNQRFIVKLRGEIPRFEDASSKFKLDSKGRRFINAASLTGNPNAMPRE